MVFRSFQYKYTVNRFSDISISIDALNLITDYEAQ